MKPPFVWRPIYVINPPADGSHFYMQPIGPGGIVSCSAASKPGAPDVIDKWTPELDTQYYQPAPEHIEIKIDIPA
jgi:hypothetical protein